MSKAYRSGANNIAGIVAMKGGARTIQTGLVRIAGAWQTFFSAVSAPPQPPPPPPPSPLFVSVTPSYTGRTVGSADGGGAIAASISAAASGGTGTSASFSWTKLSESGDTAYTPLGTGQVGYSASINFSGPYAQHASQTYAEVWQVTVTDSTGATASASCSIFGNVRDQPN